MRSSTTPRPASDNARLGRIDDRIESVTSDLRRYLGEENKRLLPLLEAGNFAEVRASLARADTLRDEFNQKDRGHPHGHAGAGPRRCRGDDAGPADGHRHLRDPDRAGGRTGTDVCDFRQHRHYPAGPAAAGRYPRRRGRPARWIDRRHHARRDRPAHVRVQQHGRAIAPQGEDARDLRPLYRSARRRRVDRTAVADRQPTASAA